MYPSRPIINGISTTFSRRCGNLSNTYANVILFLKKPCGFIEINFFVVLIVTRNRKDSCPTTMPRSSCNLIGALWRNFVTNCIALFLRNSYSKLILCSYLMVLININRCCGFQKYLYSALVWGSSVKDQPQKVGKDHLTTRMSCKLSKRF